MDELKALWGEIRSDADLELLTARSISDNIRKTSKGTIAKLHRQIMMKFWSCNSILLSLLVAIPFMERVEIQIFLSILLIAYLTGSILLFQESRIMKAYMDMNQNLLNALKVFHQRFKALLHYEQIISLILYPISATAGFLVGMYFFNNQTTFLNEPQDWLWLLIPMTVLMPLSYWLNFKWNQYSYGAHLNNLTQNIRELEAGT